MQIVELMLDNGWTYQEYRRQPQWVIEHILARKKAAARVRKV